MIIGMDPHQRSVTIEVMTSDETVLDRGRYATDRSGYAAMLRDARRWPGRVWAIEGCSGIGRHVATRLLADGEQVVDVPPKLSARVRVFSTVQGLNTQLSDPQAAGRGTTLAEALPPVSASSLLTPTRYRGCSCECRPDRSSACQDVRQACAGRCGVPRGVRDDPVEGPLLVSEALAQHPSHGTRGRYGPKALRLRQRRRPPTEGRLQNDTRSDARRCTPAEVAINLSWAAQLTWGVSEQRWYVARHADRLVGEGELLRGDPASPLGRFTCPRCQRSSDSRRKGRVTNVLPSNCPVPGLMEALLNPERVAADAEHQAAGPWSG